MSTEQFCILTVALGDSFVILPEITSSYYSTFCNMSMIENVTKLVNPMVIGALL